VTPTAWGYLCGWCGSCDVRGSVRLLDVCGIMENVATLRVAPDLAAAYPTSPDASLWLDDLRWHKKMYRESRFRWTGQDAVGIVTWETGGQTEFVTLADLELLQRIQYKVLGLADPARNAMAQRLQLAYDAFGDGWATTSEALGLSEVECSAAVWFAEHAAPEDFDSVNVRRVLKFVPFRNPLIEAWELKQLVRVFEAAGNLLEDAICDLAQELLPTRPEAAIAAAMNTSPLGVTQRVAAALEERGGAGDERRIPEQVF